MKYVKCHTHTYQKGSYSLYVISVKEGSKSEFYVFYFVVVILLHKMDHAMKYILFTCTPFSIVGSLFICITYGLFHELHKPGKFVFVTFPYSYL